MYNLYILYKWSNLITFIYIIIYNFPLCISMHFLCQREDKEQNNICPSDLQLLNQEFIRNMITVLKVPMAKADSLQGQMGNVSREVEILGNDGKEMLEIQDIGTKIKNAFDRLMNK